MGMCPQVWGPVAHLMNRAMDARNRATAWGQPNADAQTVLDAALPADVLEGERQALRALILDALRCLHEGVLARYVACGPASARHAGLDRALLEKVSGLRLIGKPFRLSLPQFIRSRIRLGSRRG